MHSPSNAIRSFVPIPRHFALSGQLVDPSTICITDIWRLPVTLLDNAPAISPTVWTRGSCSIWLLFRGLQSASQAANNLFEPGMCCSFTASTDRITLEWYLIPATSILLHHFRSSLLSKHPQSPLNRLRQNPQPLQTPIKVRESLQHHDTSNLVARTTVTV